MKLLTFIGIVVMMISCSETKEKEQSKTEEPDDYSKLEGYEVEDVLCRCYEKRDDLKEFRALVNSLEADLIEKNILKDASPEAYDRLLEQFPGVLEGYKIPGLEEFLPLEVSELLMPCQAELAEMDNAVVKKSRFYQLGQTQLEFFRKEAPDIHEMYQFTSDFITEKDMAHPYYRTFLLYVLIISADLPDTGVKVTVPEKVDDERPSRSKVCVFKIDDQGQISTGHGTITKDLAIQMIRDGILSEVTNVEFVLNLLSGTTQAHLDEYIQLLEDTYMEVYNQKSLDIYDKPFDELEPLQKDMIETRYPKSYSHTGLPSEDYDNF